MALPHFLVVAFPGQGHVNPALQLAKHLFRHGAHVTFSTTTSAYHRMNKSTIPQELSFANFSEGNDDGENIKVDNKLSLYVAQIEHCGPETLREQIMASINEGRSFSCIIYTNLIPWVADIARSVRIPSVLLWAQPAAVLDIYYYYFSGYSDAIKKAHNDPLCPVELPLPNGVPHLFLHNLPSFIQPGTDVPLYNKHIVNIKEEPKVLVNTFDALEPEALKAIDKLDLVAIGPLTPSALFDDHDPSHTTYGGDLFEGSTEYIGWLNTKSEGSVVYVACGSINVLPKQQMEEMARGLLDMGKPFLWIIRDQATKEGEEGKDQLSCKEELDRQGMITPWCCQVEVLSHPSVGCFLTHCGWNSTLESLVCGVPVVAIPQWADQPTNAKLVQDLWKTGIQLTKNDEGIVENNEIKKCLELVMGDSAEGKEMRENAKKWKELAREAGRLGGYSDRNLKAFIEDFVEAHN